MRHAPTLTPAVRRPVALCVLAALLLALALTGPAAARPFTIDDLLKLEHFGEAAIDPTGRWLVFDRTDPYDSGTRYETDLMNELRLSRLYLTDLARPGPARRLIPNEAAAGHVAGPFSPGGSRLVIYRFRGQRWELGVAEIPSGKVRWLEAVPEYNLNATTVQWISDTELLVLSRSDGRPPWVLRSYTEAPNKLPTLWAAPTTGGSASSVFGSGAHRNVNPPRPPIELLRFDVVTGERRFLASGDFLDMEAAPGGAHAALLENAGVLQPQPGKPVQGPSGMAMERRRLIVVDLTTGERTIPCPTCDVLENLLAWSPDGRTLLVHVRAENRPWSEGRLQRHDVGTPGLTPLPQAILPEVRTRPDIVRAWWMGRDPIVYGRPATQSDARSDWWRLSPAGPVNLTAGLKAPRPTLTALDETALTLMADGAAWRIDPMGRARRLTAEPLTAWPFPRTRFNDRAALSPAAKADALGLVDDRLLAASAGHAPTPTVLPAGSRVLAWSPASKAAVVLTGEDTRPQALQVITPKGAVTVATGNDHLRDVDMPRVVAINHKGPEGQPLKSWLLLPHDPPKDGRPPPLVIRPYLGSTFPTAFPTTPYVDQFTVSMELLAAQGYAVLLPSLPKSRTTDDFVTGLADRLLAIVDKAAADPALKGAFDPDRMALWSHSYGGYTIAHILAQTDRFKAAVSSSAPFEMTSAHGTFQSIWRVSPELGTWVAYAAGWAEDAQGGMGGPPWALPERYVKASPVYQADRIRTPLLMFQGDQDFIAPAQAEMMFSALYRQDRDAMLVLYWGEGHALGSPATIRDRYARGLAWLERYLGGRPGER